MSPQDRWKAARLESIMARYRSAESKTLADLHRAGFRFQSVRSAERWLKAQRTWAGFTQEQIGRALRGVTETEK